MDNKNRLIVSTFEILKTYIIMILVSTIVSVILSFAFFNIQQTNALYSLVEEFLTSGFLFVFFFKLAKDYGIKIKDLFKKCKIKYDEFIAWTSLACAINNSIIILSLVVSLILAFIFIFFNLSIPDTAPITSEVYSIYTFLSLFIQVVIIAPIIEEIVFRGIIFNILKEHGTRIAILITSLIFAAAHGNLISMIPVFFASVILIRITLYYDSIIPAIIIHGFNNFINLLSQNILTESGILFITAFAVLNLLLIVFFFVKGYYKKLKLKNPIPDSVELKSLLVPKIILMLLVLLLLL